MSPKTIGLIAHTGKKGAAELVQAVADEFGRFSIAVLMEKETAALAGFRSDFAIGELGAKTDLLVVLGGDGTLLNVAGQLGDTIKPIFGINVGSLGFLTCSSSSAIREAERTLLEVTITRPAPDRPAMIALNDAVFSRGELSRLIRLRVRVNGESLTEFNADGLIVATPTGSTAYSLSAGGPIMSPDSGVLAIAPICPHVLTNRSIIISDQSIIEVDVTEHDYAVYLTVDGREPLRLDTGAVVRITKADKTLPLAVMPDTSFFSVVRQKLKWSGSNI